MVTYLFNIKSCLPFTTNCVTRNSTDCAALGGSYSRGQQCSTSFCPLPIASCCNKDDTCVLTNNVNCTANNGTFSLFNTQCIYGQCFKNLIIPQFNCNINTKNKVNLL